MHGLPFEILLLDDDADDRFIMDEAFMQIGYQAEVKKFITGDALIGYLKKIDSSLYPSLIVMDDRLKGLDAGKILSILKADPAYRHIPVIVYSGVVSPQKRDQLLSQGAYDYIEKGISMNDYVRIAKDLKELAEARIEKSK